MAVFRGVCSSILLGVCRVFFRLKIVLLKFNSAGRIFLLEIEKSKNYGHYIENW